MSAGTPTAYGTFGTTTAFGGSSLGVGNEAAGDDGRSPSFRTSLSDVSRQMRDADMRRSRMALGVGDDAPTLPFVYTTPSRWDVWVEGRYSANNDTAGGLDRSGHAALVFLGADYRVTPDLIVGALAQYDTAKDKSSTLSSETTGDGWMAGPYMSARLDANTYLDLRAAWGTSANDMSLDGATGQFDTTRWLVKGTLAGSWTSGNWRFTPSAELAYVSERHDAFTNSSGTLLSEQSISLGRLQFGPEIAYRFGETEHTFIEPFFAVKGDWDFNNPNVAIVNGAVVGPGDLWGRLEAGLNVMTAGGTFVRGQASWDGLGSSDYSGYTLQGIANIPLN